MGSSRLPTKVMMLINGKPMIGYQIERLLKTGFQVILSTSEDANNNKLAEYVKGLGIEVFRGSEDNVLERYYETAKHYNSTDIIRITGDNPLVDGNFISKELSNFCPKTRKYYLHEGKFKILPLGMSFEMFSWELLTEAYQNANSNSEKEHVTPYMHQNMPGNIEISQFVTKINYPGARLTVDTIEDFKLIKELIENYQCHQKSLEDIIKVIHDNGTLVQINSDIHQKAWNE